MDRYIILNESTSGHCCFKHTVIDTSKGKAKDGDGNEMEEYWEHTVCECFEEEDAKQIVEALNLLEKNTY